MFSPSISPIRRTQQSVHKSSGDSRSPQSALWMQSDKDAPVVSQHQSGDFMLLKQVVEDTRVAMRESRSALARALDRLGQHHVKNRDYDDAMDLFTEALHEKRSVFSQLVPSQNGPSRSRAESDESLFDGDNEGVDQLRKTTTDEIVQTLKNMGNVHSLRGEQDEAMRYYTEVTGLRANRCSTKDATSVESFGRSTAFGDEDNSTLMSEINEDVKALDDLFRSISFRNIDGTDNTVKSETKPLSPTNADKSRKRRRGELRENGSSENEPFKRSTSLGMRSINELTEALDYYRNLIEFEEVDKDHHEEQLNSFSLRAELLQDNHKRSDMNESFSRLPDVSTSRIAELNLAMEVYRHVLTAQREIQIPNDLNDKERKGSASCASTLIRMGGLCYKLNNVDDELEMYREAKSVYIHAFGENHAYVAGTRKNIGMVLAERGEYEEAVEQFEIARRVYIQVNDGAETSRDVASAISCMGNVMNRMGELDEALKHYVHALGIYRTVRQEDNAEDAKRDVTATLKIIGMVYGKKGELDIAMDYFSQAMSLLRSSGEPTTLAEKETAASISSRIAGIYFKKGEYEQAMSHYQKSHDMTVELKGVNHPEVAGILHYIGGIHHKHQHYEEAMTCYQESVRIYHCTLGPGHPAVAATLVCIGSLHYKRRNLDSAMMFYREALRLNRDAYGLHHPDVAPTLKSIGTILTKKGEYDEAYDIFRDVLSIKCTVHGTGHPEVANAYKSLGNIHYKRGELADAERQYRHALNIYRRTRGEDHSETKSARTSIGHIRYWIKERGNAQHHENRETRGNRNGGERRN